MNIGLFNWFCLKARKLQAELNMVKLEKFDIEFNNVESAYFAGQEISGKVTFATVENDSLKL